MTSGLYTIATALEARARAQEVIAHNLANAETLGYRRQVPAFFGFSAALKQADLDMQPEQHVEKGSGVSLRPPAWDLNSAALRMTGRELDFAVRGEGFFVVRTPGGEMLTRDGHFVVDESGVLKTTNGYPVLGRNGEITLSKGKVSVKADGSVNVDGTSVGILRVELPSQPDSLSSVGGGLFQYDGNGTAPDAADYQVVNGAVELSNVNVPAEMVNMLNNSRMTETAARSMQIVDESMGKGIASLGA